MHEPSHFTLVAILAALQAGGLLSKGFGTEFVVSHKTGKQNLVTEYDKLSEECILSLILSHFPSHAFIAEERGASDPSPSGITWLIDPLDGTVNFARGLPHFSVSIAAAAHTEIVSGVVYQPMTNELFVAEKGKGAYLNGKRLHVSHTKDLDQAMLSTGFPYNVDQNPLHCIDQFVHMLKRGIPVRRLGSAAMDLAYVAAGRFDAYWEATLHPWDIAAGKLLVEEAGGRVTHQNGTPHEIFGYKSLLATNEALHPQMLQHLRAP